MSEEIITKLKKKRGTSRSAVTKILNKIESDLSEDKINVNELEENLELLNCKVDILKSVDSELEAVLKPEEIESHLQNVDEYLDKIILCRFRANKKINEVKNQNLLINSPLKSTQNLNEEIPMREHVSKASVNVKLPKLTITKFYGDISQWLTFWSSYESAVHENETLTKIDKFNYLKAHLCGSALNTINGFSITSDNYDKAVKLLIDRYGRKDVLINTHMSNLLNISPLKHSNDVRSFRNLLDNCQTQIRSLESLGISSDTYGNLLSPVILKCLPSDLIFEFNKYTGNSEYKVEDLITFLNTQLSAREKIGTLPDNSRNAVERCVNADSLGKYKQKCNRMGKEKIPTSADLLSSEVNENMKSTCVFCNKFHDSERCDYARNISIEERKSILMKKGVCFRCLKQNKHLSRQCKVKVICELCKGRHFDIMCFSTQNNCLNKTEAKCEKEINEHTVLSNSCTKEVYLQTLIVNITENGKEYLVRIIIDSGSQKSYISKFLAEKLGLKFLGEETVVHGLFGGVEKIEKHKRYLVKLSSIDKKYRVQFEAMDQKQICSNIPRIGDRDCIAALKELGIFVSDIALNENSCLFEKNSNEIHVLLGADLAGKLYTGEIKHLSKGLVAMNTNLGWTILGKGSNENINDSSLLVLSLHVSNAQISDLWSLDSLGITDPIEKKTKTELEELAFKHFKETVERDEEGRYQVRIPWLEGHPPLLDNKDLCRKRLNNAVRSLHSSCKLEAYQQVFSEWEKENIIERINSSEDSNKEENLSIHFLPHRAVIKENSTTKIRPVFDGSAKTRNSVSLNDCIEKGPNLIELIPSVLNRFRWGTIGVIADIRKAFLQIGLHENDRNFLRFLWWQDGNPASEICYRHRRVVFGLSCSPFLLAAVLTHHFDQTTEEEELARKIKDSMYVDNCVTSVDSFEELNLFRSGSQKLLSSAKFDLRGWVHTRPPSPIDHCEGKEEVSVLGLSWNPHDDTLSIDLKTFTDQETISITKRKILSLVHTIFDPIGFSCPFTLIPKLLLQECWRLKISWDSELPSEIATKYQKWKNQLSELKKIKIPRRLSVLELQHENLSLHVFCDACQSSYATCIFLRVEAKNAVTCQLVQARSKVAPRKRASIPRLELLACSIGARLANTVKRDLRLDDIETFFWSDSMDVLYWIKKKDNWGVFVSNRVTEIRNLTSTDQWNYVLGVQNPADLPSRGSSAQKLAKGKWWEGPTWLRYSRDEWPNFELIPNEETINSERKKIIVSSVNEEKLDFFYRVSSYKKIIRITAWIYRFFKNSRRPVDKSQGSLTASEIQKAENIILKKVQEDFLLGKEDKRLRSLTIITDSEGLLRVKTKVFMRKDEENFRLPVVLPSDHHVVKSLIMWKHQDLGHAGVQYLMSALREYNKTVKEYNLEEGDIVLLGDDNVKRNNWCLAKVIKMYPGKDGKVRVAEVKTKHGTYLRPVQKLYPLELKDNDKLLKKNNPDVVTGDCSSTPSANPSRDPEHLNNTEVVTQISRFGRPLKKIQRMNL